jgi:D-sedoheptulose 7-phosphate isomerase
VGRRGGLLKVLPSSHLEQQSMAKVTSMPQHVRNYSEKLSRALELDAMAAVPILGEALRESWKLGRAVYLCGNGGSAGNAIHLANDLLYAAGISNGIGLRVEALSANPAVLTSLANDIGYEHIFAEQLRVKASRGDILIVLSGSGNSANVVKALEIGNAKAMKTFAILGYSGGRCKEIAQHPIHFEINDMQISEDLQLIVGHICMQWLYANPVNPRPIARNP